MKEVEPGAEPNRPLDHKSAWAELGSGSPPELERQPTASYSIGTVLAGLLLALSLLGSLIWRAFPPSVLLRSNPSVAGSASTLALPAEVVVPAASRWVDSGLLMQGNSSYRISARGEVVLSRQNGFDLATGPAGFSNQCRPSQGQACVLAGEPYGALIGKLGQTDAFYIGPVLILETGAGGRLWLAVNDYQDSYHDNQGHFTVLLERYEPAPFQRVYLRSPRPAPLPK